MLEKKKLIEEEVDKVTKRNDLVSLRLEPET